MEQNLVSAVDFIKRTNDVLNGSEEKKIDEVKLENSSAEKFHDVSDSIEIRKSDSTEERPEAIDLSKKDLELENRNLASQLEAERKKSKELQSRFQLFENSAKYLERLNGQLETIKRTVEEENLALNDQGDYFMGNYDAMQKLRPKTIHTSAHGDFSGVKDGTDDGAAISSEPQPEDSREGQPKPKRRDHRNKDEIAFRDAEDFKQLEQHLEIMKDVESGNDAEAEKVFITKTEKKCLEDIGNLASRMRTPLDDKHQQFFEKDRKRFASRILMPETQEIDKTETVPADLAAKAKETPVSITSTELDGLRSYLLQLKELIARRETAWARTTERDYNQRVEITRFKNEVSHLRMLCEKRQKDIKERDQIILSKDEEIKELQKKIHGMKNTLLKLERKDERLNDTLDGLTSDVLENSHLVQKSYNGMKKAALMSKGLINPGNSKTGQSSLRRTSSGKDIQSKQVKQPQEKPVTRKIKSTSSNSNDEESKTPRVKSKLKTSNLASKTKQAKRKTSIERVEEKLQRIDEMLHSEVLRGEKKSEWMQPPKTTEKKGNFLVRGVSDVGPAFQKLTPSNSKMRQEMLGALAGVNISPDRGLKAVPMIEAKRNQGSAAILANALLAARNTNMFNF